MAHHTQTKVTAAPADFSTWQWFEMLAGSTAEALPSFDGGSYAGPAGGPSEGYPGEAQITTAASSKIRLMRTQTAPYIVVRVFTTGTENTTLTLNFLGWNKPGAAGLIATVELTIGAATYAYNPATGKAWGAGGLTGTSGSFRECDQAAVTGGLVAGAIRSYADGQVYLYIPTLEFTHVEAWLTANAGAGEVVVLAKPSAGPPPAGEVGTALAKSSTQVYNATAVTTTTSAAQDMTNAYEMQWDVSVTQAGAITTGTSVQIQVSPDNSNWFNYGAPLIAGLSATTYTFGGVQLPPATKYTRLSLTVPAGGGTATITAFITKITSL